MTDPYRQCSSYETKKRRLAKWRQDFINQIEQKHTEKLRALRAELSPAALRLVEVAESSTEYVAAVSDVNAQVTADELDDPCPIPPCLLDPSDPMPVPGIIEVPDRPKRDRAARR